MSQKDLADATDGRLSESWVQKFLGNERQPKYPTRVHLEALVDALNTKLDPPTSLSYVMAPMEISPIEDVRGRDWLPLMDVDDSVPEDLRQTVRRLILAARKIYVGGEPDKGGKDD